MHGDSGYAYLPAGQAELEFAKYEKRIAELAAEIDRMRPVVEAVKHWRLSRFAPSRAIALGEAYDSYETNKHAQ